MVLVHVGQDIRISPNGKTFFVADMKAGGVFLIDGEAFKEVGFIPTGGGHPRPLPEPGRGEALRAD